MCACIKHRIYFSFHTANTSIGKTLHDEYLRKTTNMRVQYSVCARVRARHSGALPLLCQAPRTDPAHWWHAAKQLVLEHAYRLLEEML